MESYGIEIKIPFETLKNKRHILWEYKPLTRILLFQPNRFPNPLTDDQLYSMGSF